MGGDGEVGLGLMVSDGVRQEGLALMVCDCNNDSRDTARDLVSHAQPRATLSLYRTWNPETS